MDDARSGKKTSTLPDDDAGRSRGRTRSTSERTKFRDIEISSRTNVRTRRLTETFLRRFRRVRRVRRERPFDALARAFDRASTSHRRSNRSRGVIRARRTRRRLTRQRIRASLATGQTSTRARKRRKSHRSLTSSTNRSNAPMHGPRRCRRSRSRTYVYAIALESVIVRERRR